VPETKRRKQVPRPEEVGHAKFPVEQVLYDDGHFSVAYGWWEEEQEQRIGMRWNGQGEDAGYPKLFGNPVWFLLPECMTIPTLKSLLEQQDARRSEVAELLARLLRT
jgi:hypothetical protein